MQHVVDRLAAAAARASRRPSRPRRPAATGPRSSSAAEPGDARGDAASASAQTTWSARDRGRRGRSHATRATTDGVPVPVAEHLARRERRPAPRAPSAGSRPRTRSDSSGPGRSGSCRRRRGRRPGRAPGSSPARRAPAPPSGRRRRGRSRRRTRRSGSQTGSPSGVGAGRRAARTRRPPRPAAPARRLVDVQQRGRRLELAHPEPAAAQRRRAARCPSGRAAARPGVPPRTRRRPRPGRPWPGRARTSRPRAPRPPARAWCARRGAPARPRPAPGRRRRRVAPAAGGPAAPRPECRRPPGSTVCRADPVVAWPPFSSTWSSIARAAGLSSARRCRLRPWDAASGDTGCRPLTPRGTAAGEPLGHAAQSAQPAGCLPHQGQVEQPLERGGHGLAGAAFTIDVELPPLGV